MRKLPSGSGPTWKVNLRTPHTTHPSEAARLPLPNEAVPLIFARQDHFSNQCCRSITTLEHGGPWLLLSTATAEVEASEVGLFAMKRVEGTCRPLLHLSPRGPRMFRLGILGGLSSDVWWFSILQPSQV